MKNVVRQAIKGIALGISLVAAFPGALLCGFGRIEVLFALFAQNFALVPGIVGDYLRIAYYHLTLTACPLNSRVQFGSFFPHPQVRLGSSVYIGPYCILGCTNIGDRTQIAAGVQIPSGRHQHNRDETGRILSADRKEFTAVMIGKDCWIGSAAVVMADLGERCTIGAGSVVTKPIPAGSVAVGNPARVIRQENAN
jgi:acetyltransferase-like isoleucine patch superfamily enzyme